MDTPALERFAQSSRRRLIEQVSTKLQLIISEGSAARRENPKAIQNLEKQLQSAKSDKSYDDVQEEYDEIIPEPILLEKTVNSSDISGFGITAIMGLTLPVLQPPLGIGPNFGLRLDTPISFTLVGKEVKVGTDFYSSIMSSDNSPWYTTTNIVGNISISPLSSIKIRTGLGLSPLSIGDYSTIALSIPVDVNYYLPMNVSGFKFALNLHAQRTLGYPSKEGVELGDATDFLYLGLLINTPLKF